MLRVARPSPLSDPGRESSEHQTFPLEQLDIGTMRAHRFVSIRHIVTE